MYVGVQTVPIVFVDNKTDQIIKDLSFSYEGLAAELKAKKIKPDERKLIAIYNRGIVGEKTLYMNYTNEQGINSSYSIFDELTEQYCKNILVEIDSVLKDGSLDIKVLFDFIYD